MPPDFDYLNELYKVIGVNDTEDKMPRDFPPISRTHESFLDQCEASSIL